MMTASLAPLRMADLQHLAIPGQKKVPRKDLRFSRFEHSSPAMLWEWEARQPENCCCAPAAWTWTAKEMLLCVVDADCEQAMAMLKSCCRPLPGRSIPSMAATTTISRRKSAASASWAVLTASAVATSTWSPRAVLATSSPPNGATAGHRRSRCASGWCWSRPGGTNARSRTRSLVGTAAPARAGSAAGTTTRPAAATGAARCSGANFTPSGGPAQRLPAPRRHVPDIQLATQGRPFCHQGTGVELHGCGQRKPV